MTMGREYHRNYSRNYYHKRKQEMIEQLGGKCVNCGSTENLEFDHIDAYSKSFDVCSFLNRSKTATDTELKKCQLLCHSCHLAKSKKEISEKLSGSNNYFYNKHGKDFPSSKPVIDLDTGEEFESATDYARLHGLKTSTVSRVCRGEQKSIKGHHVIYKTSDGE